MGFKLPSVFVSHGGGPLPLLNHPSHTQMNKTFAPKGHLWDTFHNPNINAIVCVSAHYVTSAEIGGEDGKNVILVQCETNPKLYFDYSGFPPESYKFTMPNPGSIPLAEKIVSMINNEGIFSNNDEISEYSRPILSAKLDRRQRGFDHGVFVPMLALDVPAHLPVVTVSLANDQDTRAHIALGKALAPLREKGVLIVGSGLSFHNLNGFFSRGSVQPQHTRMRARAFDEGLEKLVTKAAQSSIFELEQWKEIPYSDYCHPTAEHLMPLFVVAGCTLFDSSHDVKIHKIPFTVMADIAASHFIFE